MVRKTQNKKKRVKYRQIHALAHQYRSMLIIAMSVFAMSFGLTMAQISTNTITLSTNQQLDRSQLPALMSDMQFEDKQVKRDIAKLVSEITTTENYLKNGTFSCDALAQSRSYLSVLTDFDSYVNNITTNSPTANIVATYQLFSIIHGTKEQSSIRNNIYGGVDSSGKKVTGSISQMATCRTISQVIKKTCAADYSLARSKEMGQSSKESKKLRTSISNELHSRCSKPNAVMMQSRITLADLTPVDNKTNTCVDSGSFQAHTLLDQISISVGGAGTSCSSVIDKYLGSEKLLLRLRGSK